MTSTLDPRVHAVDPDTRRADRALRDVLTGDGWTFVTPRPARAAARVGLRARPHPDAAQVTEALPGEALHVLWDGPGGWLRVRTAHDGYLGWVRADALADPPADDTVLTVTALRAHAYAEPRVSAPLRAELCLGSRVARAPGEVVADAHRRWVPVDLPGGPAFVQEVVLAPLPDRDPAALALRFLDVPYVWGGRSAWGLDCSGLTQLAYGAFGMRLPRDADQQHAALRAVDTPGRGDLAFFPGHVGVMLDGMAMVHANATHMRVSVDTLGEGVHGRRLAGELLGYGRWSA